MSDPVLAKVLTMADHVTRQEGLGCRRCGEPSSGLAMHEAIALGWWFTPPTDAPDEPDAYCPKCAEFLQWAVLHDYEPGQQACTLCGNMTVHAALKGGHCIDCIWADARGARRRLRELAVNLGIANYTP